MNVKTHRHTNETGEVSVTVKPKHEWDRMMTKIMAEGERLAKRLKDQGHIHKVEILAPKKVHDGDAPVTLSGVMLELDWKITTRLEMIEHARDMITKAFMLDEMAPALPAVLKAIIEGRGLYEHGIGEFFLLYGKFEQKYHTNSTKTQDKMSELIEGRSEKDRLECMKSYISPQGSAARAGPLPYVVRNILAHIGTDHHNKLEAQDIEKSIKLLSSWKGIVGFAKRARGEPVYVHAFW